MSTHTAHPVCAHSKPPLVCEEAVVCVPVEAIDVWELAMEVCDGLFELPCALDG